MILSRSQRPFKLSKIVLILAQLSQKQPRKFVMLKFSSEGLDIMTKDDTSSISIGVKIGKKAFSAYICEFENNILVPLEKLSKILCLPSELDDSITVSYQMPTEEIKFRIHSTSTSELITENNLKTLVSLQIPKLDIQNKMINEQYEEPANPFQILEKLEELQVINPFNMMNNTLGMIPNRIELTHGYFSIQTNEFHKICQEFSEVCTQLTMGLEAEPGSNQKYMRLATMTKNGLKSIMLNQQRSHSQIQKQMLTNSKLNLKETIPVNVLVLATTIATDGDLFNGTIRIVLEAKKSVILICDMKDYEGSIVFMSSCLSSGFYF